ncbi:MAG: Ig-like domain-containing protein [Candidatus Marinimicrobia bacterium]|nr:Ig-like domain-containing protein [Candidatus Neomarinimicrobiota bacterium]MBL7010894.1 Ig-like domain-containing protein [Candidatus Neomarinimicrobiota bacterium]MBL7030277.1 Ig-like domain-containing protein [Candidatus Neomarinimicrobiota bacterium]
MIYSCAAVAPPDGGPKDEIPPQFVSATPKAGSLYFKGGEVSIKFSEYIGEKSIKNAIKISPRLDSPAGIKYADDEIIINFPENLLSDQTYVITLNRNLKDERGVALDQSIQIAFSTGDVIDEGIISGRVFGEDGYGVHLWKLKSGFDDSVFFTEPLYVAEADDDGFFNFKYLAPGDYVLMGIERSAAGANLIPERMAHGVSSDTLYSLGKNQIVEGVFLNPKRETPPLKMTHGEWMGQRWGWMYFNWELDEITFEGLNVIDSKETVQPLDFYQDEQDKKRFLIMAPDTLNSGKAELRLAAVLSKVDTLLAHAKINFRVPTKSDTTHVKQSLPKSTVTVRLEKDGGPTIPIVFSKPIMAVTDSAFFLVADSDTVVVAFDWINPIEIEFLPPNGWEEKTKYILMIFADKLTPIEGKSLKDSVNYVRFNSEKKLGYGGLSGMVEDGGVNPLIELSALKKESEIFHSSVNSDLQFHFSNIPEGPYRLMIIFDRDRNGEFSYGSVHPFQPSEWFYIHPDTFDVRANWDIDVGLIREERE